MKKRFTRLMMVTVVLSVIMIVSMVMTAVRIGIDEFSG
jgi:hypothetical protein